MDDDKGFGDFKDWAEDFGIDLRYEDDWMPWWECWKNGYEKGRSDVKDGV